jgi:hypothetical protein
VDRLRELACDAAQGYYLGRPMDRDLMTGWLQRDALLGSTPHPGEAAPVPLAEGRPHLRSVATRSGTDG